MPQKIHQAEEGDARRKVSPPEGDSGHSHGLAADLEGEDLRDQRNNHGTRSEGPEDRQENEAHQGHRPQKLAQLGQFEVKSQKDEAKEGASQADEQQGPPPHPV